MIRISLDFTRDGLLRRLEAKGHGGLGSTGSDIVCAAVTSMVRTAAQIIERMPGTEMSGGAEKPGDLRFEIERVSERRESYLQAVGDFVVLGLKSIERDYPDQCHVEMNTIDT